MKKEVIQSYIFTTLVLKTSVSEKRILYLILEKIQDWFKGLELTKSYEPTLNDLDISLNVKDALAGNSNNRERLKESIKKLNSLFFEFENDEKWYGMNLIERPTIYKQSNIVTFKIPYELAKILLDFTKGFRKYDLEVAMNLPSPKYMKMYELISNKQEPIIYKVRELKQILLCESYSNSDFLKKVLQPIKDKLLKQAPYSFHFEAKKSYNSPKEYDLVVLKPFHNLKIVTASEEKKIINQVTLSFFINKELRDHLENSYYFKKKELENNKELLAQAVKHIFDLKGFLSEKKTIALQNNIVNIKGYLISCIKNELQNIQNK